MEDPERSSQTMNEQHRQISGKRRRKHGGKGAAEDHGGGGGGCEEEECDPQLWETLSKGFKDAQSFLDENRRLIQQVNDNQRSKDPDNLVQNVALIHEINGNVSKVRGIYSNLAVNFSSIVGEKRTSGGKSSDSGNN